MKIIYSLICILILVGCNSIESSEKLWEQVQDFRTQKDLQKFFLQNLKKKRFLKNL